MHNPSLASQHASQSSAPLGMRQHPASYSTCALLMPLHSVLSSRQIGTGEGVGGRSRAGRGTGVAGPGAGAHGEVVVARGGRERSAQVRVICGHAVDERVEHLRGHQIGLRAGNQVGLRAGQIGLRVSQAAAPPRSAAPWQVGVAPDGAGRSGSSRPWQEAALRRRGLAPWRRPWRAGRPPWGRGRARWSAARAPAPRAHWGPPSPPPVRQRRQ